jgi:cytochrome c oxidase accessory protein FixG
MTFSPQRPVAPWRRLCLYGGICVLLLLTFLPFGQGGLLAYDLDLAELHFFGLVLPIEEFHLLLLFCLALLFLFLLTALVLGRVWCGWLCPQTALTDLAEGLARRLGLTVSASRIFGQAKRRLLFHLCCLAIAGFAAAALLWLFIPPQRFFTHLLALSLPLPATVFLVLAALLIYVDLAFVGRLACRTVCPYGRLQAALAEAGTLTLRFAPAVGERCHNCRACVRACPFELDIRTGDQGECINCGRCLDACRAAIASRGRGGLIHYAFGAHGTPLHAIFNLRTVLVASVLLVVTGLLLLATMRRPLAELSVIRAPGAVRVSQNGGSGAIFFSAELVNRGKDGQFSLSARLADGSNLDLLGPVRDLHLRDGEKRRIDFALLPPAVRLPGATPFELLLSDSAGRIILIRRAFLPPEESR